MHAFENILSHGAFYCSYNISNSMKLICITDFGCNMLALNYGVSSIYSSFSGTCKIISLIYNLFGKNVCSVFQRCCSISNIIKFIYITRSTMTCFLQIMICVVHSISSSFTKTHKRIRSKNCLREIIAETGFLYLADACILILSLDKI